MDESFKESLYSLAKSYKSFITRIQKILSSVKFQNFFESLKTFVNALPTKEDIERYKEINTKIFKITYDNDWFYDRGFLIHNGIYIDEDILKLNRKRKNKKSAIDNLFLSTYTDDLIDKMVNEFEKNIEDIKICQCFKECCEVYKQKKYYLTYCGCVPIIDSILRLYDNQFSHKSKKAQEVGKAILTEIEDDQPISILGHQMGTLFATTYYKHDYNSNSYNREILNRNNIHGYSFQDYSQKGGLNCLIIVSLLSQYYNNKKIIKRKTNETKI